MKYDFTIVALWAIAVMATFLIVQETRFLTVLGPLYAVCMIGSVVTVRKARDVSRKA